MKKSKMGKMMRTNIQNLSHRLKDITICEIC
jgi:hypothetical protein